MNDLFFNILDNEIKGSGDYSGDGANVNNSNSDVSSKYFLNKPSNIKAKYCFIS